jgi:hypothetical protein
MRVAAVAACALLATMAACEPCAGTASCHEAPGLRYSGQFIEHDGGAAVSGVRIAFARRHGARLESDTISAVSGAGGFFELQGETRTRGTVTGDLLVTPPPPFAPYRVPDVRLTVSPSGIRGDGQIFGRLVVDPYLIIIGELHDRRTNAVIPGAEVRMRRVAGARITPDSVLFVTGTDGRFFLQPTVHEFGDVVADFEIAVAGAPRLYVVRQRIRTQHVDEEGLRFVLLNAGRAMLYVGQTIRRGYGKPLPGTTVEVVQTAGIAVAPTQLVPVLDPDGRFALQPEPQADGEAVFDITVRPPAPFPTRVFRDVRLRAHDDDSVRFAGLFGYGPQMALRAQLEYRGSGEAVNDGAEIRVRRIAGLPFTEPSAGEVAFVDSVGHVRFSAPTATEGAVTVDLEIVLPPPASSEFIRGVTVPARDDSIETDLGRLRVGLWYPQIGRVVDATTESPIAGATIAYRRTGGARASPSVYSVTSAADGTFPLRLVPRDAGEVVGRLSLSAPGHRDTTYADVRLRATQDDTVRSAGVFRVRRAAP